MWTLQTLRTWRLRLWRLRASFPFCVFRSILCILHFFGSTYVVMCEGGREGGAEGYRYDLAFSAACWTESRRSNIPCATAFPSRPPNFDIKCDRRENSVDSGAESFLLSTKFDICRHVVMVGRRKRNSSTSSGPAGFLVRRERAMLLSFRM